MNMTCSCPVRHDKMYEEVDQQTIEILRGIFYDKRNERGRFATVWSDIC